MFLKCSERRKNGKVHRSWSVVESRRYAGGKVAQNHVLYLGELNDSQERAWERSLSVFDEQTGEHRLTRLEGELTELPWREVHAKLRGKLLPRDVEVYVLAHREARTDKERGMRRRALKILETPRSIHAGKKISPSMSCC